MQGRHTDLILGAKGARLDEVGKEGTRVRNSARDRLRLRQARILAEELSPRCGVEEIPRGEGLGPKELKHVGAETRVLVSGVRRAVPARI